MTGSLARERAMSISDFAPTCSHLLKFAIRHGFLYCSSSNINIGRFSIYIHYAHDDEL